MKREKIFLWGVSTLSVFLLANLMQCANPVDDPPLRFRTKMEIPVSNERFLLGEEFDNLFTFEDLDILNVLDRYYSDPLKLQPDTIKGDTVVFSVANADSSEFESRQEAFGDKEYHVTLGTLTVSGAAEQRDTLPLPASSGVYSTAIPVTLDSVYEIRFAAAADNKLSVRLTNLGTIPINNVSFGIGGVDTVTVGTIDAGSGEIAELNVSGKTVYHTVVLFLSCSKDGTAGQSVAINFSVNGLKADYLSVKDHLVNFSVEFVNPYELTDTIDVDYIDIGNGFFLYKLMNYTGLDLFVQGIHEHLWLTSFTELRGITRYEDLKGLSHDDSLRGFFGDFTKSVSIAEAHKEQAYGEGNLSSCRLFPEWDETSKKSVTKVRYFISPGKPTGKTVTITSADSLRFTIQTIDFKFREMQGVLTENYERQSDTQKVAINLPWNNSVKDSLRGKFILKKVWGDVIIGTEMPERAFLDTLRLKFIAFAPESVSVKDSLSTALTNVTKDSTFFRSIDITDVANVYSDSVAVAVKVYIPKGTRIRAVNDINVHDSAYSKYIGRMIIHVKTQYRLNAKLDWEVLSHVNMDLGTSKFKVPEALRFFSKLDERRAVFKMWLRNNSNLNLSLFSLAAPDNLMDTLDSLTMNEVYEMLKNPDLAVGKGYVNLLGNTGISVPKRDTTFEQYNEILLNDQQIKTLFSADSLNFRWWVMFRPQERDALTDTDYIDIKSRFGIEGINNTDSLLIWD